MEKAAALSEELQPGEPGLCQTVRGEVLLLKKILPNCPSQKGGKAAQAGPFSCGDT